MGDDDLTTLDADTLKKLVESLPFYACIVDDQHIYRWVNQIDPTLRREDVLGHRMAEFMPSDHATTAMDAVTRAIEHREVVEYEVRGYGGGGMETWYASRVVPLKGASRRALLLSSDVTPRKQAELQQRSSEALFRSVTEHSPDIIVLVDRDHRVVYINRDPEPPNVRRQDVLGQVIWSFTKGETDKAKLRDAIEAAFDDGASAELEAGAETSSFRYRTRVVRLNDPLASPRVMLITTDITPETRERELSTQLFHAQRMDTVGQLAGGIAHDFNNLLLVIQGNLEFARTKATDGQSIRDEIGDALTAVERATELTRGLLAFSRRQTPNRRPFKVGELVDSCVRMLKRLLPESITIDLTITADATVNADRGQIEQVVMNLCINARDAMPDGGMIELQVEPASTDRVAILVRDHGHGMEPDVRSRVFEPFFTTKAPGRGTGLGLAVVHGIITAHGGDIELHSEPGQGTTVRVALPTLEGAIAVGSAPAVESTQAPQGRLILVVEDEPMVRKLVVRMLDSQGFRVLEAERGDQAIALCHEHRDELALVLLDAVMPGLSGRDTFLSLRRDGLEMPVIFCSGYAEEALGSDFLERYEATLLRKPYTAATLLGEINRTLREGQRP